MNEGLTSNLRREWRGLLIVTIGLSLACQAVAAPTIDVIEPLASGHGVSPVAARVTPRATPASRWNDERALGDHPDLALVSVAVPFPEPAPVTQRPEAQRERFMEASASVQGGASLETIDCLEYPCLTYAELTGDDLPERSTALFDELTLGCERCNRQVSTYYDHDAQTALVVTAVYPRTGDDLTNRWINARLSARIEAYRGARATASDR
jgi:hypothetical protein